MCDYRGSLIVLVETVSLLLCCFQNLEASCKPIVSKPKPKVEPPKDTAPEKKEGEGEEAAKPKEEEGEGEREGEAATKNPGGDQGAEEKMEEDAAKGDTEDMDLD